MMAAAHDSTEFEFSDVDNIFVFKSDRNQFKVAPYRLMTARALMMRAVVICVGSHKIFMTS